jgi:hypothetical protein
MQRLSIQRGCAEFQEGKVTYSAIDCEREYRKNEGVEKGYARSNLWE